jgi:hypothetical protein
VTYGLVPAEPGCKEAATAPDDNSDTAAAKLEICINKSLFTSPADFKSLSITSEMNKIKISKIKKLKTEKWKI